MVWGLNYLIHTFNLDSYSPMLNMYASQCCNNKVIVSSTFLFGVCKGKFRRLSPVCKFLDVKTLCMYIHEILNRNKL